MRDGKWIGIGPLMSGSNDSTTYSLTREWVFGSESDLEEHLLKVSEALQEV